MPNNSPTNPLTIKLKTDEINKKKQDIITKKIEEYLKKEYYCIYYGNTDIRNCKDGVYKTKIMYDLNTAINRAISLCGDDIEGAWHKDRRNYILNTHVIVFKCSSCLETKEYEYSDFNDLLLCNTVLGDYDVIWDWHVNWDIDTNSKTFGIKKVKNKDNKHIWVSDNEINMYKPSYIVHDNILKFI